MIKKQNISKSFIFNFFFLFIIILIISLYSVDRYINKKLESQLITSLKDISDQNVKLIENEINNKFILLNNLAKEFSDYTEEEFSKSSIETNILANRFDFREIGIALPNGIAYMSSNTIFDLSKREYFRRSINGENYVSETLIDMGDQTDINVYSVPIINSNSEISGVFFAMYDTEDFLKLLQVDSFNGNGYSYIINSKGDILNISQRELIGEKNLFDRLRNNEISLKYKNINDKAIEQINNLIESDESEGYTKYYYDTYKYVVYKKLGVNDWWLATAVPSEILNERIIPIISIVKFICVFTFFFAILIIFYNIKKDKKYKLYLKNIAYRDSFTGLYNRNYLKDQLSNKKIKKHGYKSALVLFNIKNFKIINEIYGLNFGDHLIKNLAKVLENKKISEEDIIAHNNADEFLGLYFYVDIKDLENKISEIERKIRCIYYNGNRVFIELYIGIYEINNLENDFEKIYNYANIAKNKNKITSSKNFTYYNDELAEKEIKERKLEDEIKEAILRKEFKAWFQPKFNCKTKEIVGCEALARWYKKDGNVYFPNEFIEISEKNGLIKEIDKLILEDVCININRWKQSNLKCIPVSVNISRMYLNNVDIIGDLNEILNKYNISSEYIQLEITESSLVSNEKVLNKIINEMHKYGFKVLLDDFGVGYSSLNSINKLNFDTLKIDKSFISEIVSNNGKSILKYAIDLGKILGMEVVVEGVETKEQYEFLSESGCDTIQGYYFSKPVDSMSFEMILKNII